MTAPSEEDRALAKQIVKLVGQHWTRFVADKTSTVYVTPQGISSIADRLATIRAHAAAEAMERAAKLIEGYSAGQILLAAGEMTAQEMRTVKAVQRWWAAAIRSATPEGSND